MKTEERGFGMVRTRVEIVLSVVFALLTVGTAAWPRWIESVFGVDPDGGSGALEWLIVAGFGVLAIAQAFLARRHYRAARAAGL